MALSGASVTLVGACLVWVRSGRAERSSFATLRAARTLGVLHGTVSRLAPLWYLLPVVVGLVWLAAGLRRWRVAGGLAVLVGAGALAAAFAVVRSPLAAQVGVPVAAAGGALSVAGGLLLAAGRSSPRSMKADRPGTTGEAEP